MRQTRPFFAKKREAVHSFGSIEQEKQVERWMGLHATASEVRERGCVGPDRNRVPMVVVFADALWAHALFETVLAPGPGQDWGRVSVPCSSHSGSVDDQRLRRVSINLENKKHRDVPGCSGTAIPSTRKGACPLVTVWKSRTSASTKFRCSRASSVSQRYVLDSVMLKLDGYGCSACLQGTMGCIHTLMTVTPRSSGSLHVLPTENVPLLFIFDLWMNPLPLFDSAF